MARSISSTGAATAISGGSTPPSGRPAAVSSRCGHPDGDEPFGAIGPRADRRADRGAGLMEIADLLIPRGVIAQLRVSNKKQALQEIARRGATLTGLTERRIYDVLSERERHGSTGIGRGIAIPHGKFDELSRLC